MAQEWQRSMVLFSVGFELHRGQSSTFNMPGCSSSDHSTTLSVVTRWLLISWIVGILCNLLKLAGPGPPWFSLLCLTFLLSFQRNICVCDDSLLLSNLLCVQCLCVVDRALRHCKKSLNWNLFPILHILRIHANRKRRRTQPDGPMPRCMASKGLQERPCLLSREQAATIQSNRRIICEDVTFFADETEPNRRHTQCPLSKHFKFQSVHWCFCAFTLQARCQCPLHQCQSVS